MRKATGINPQLCQEVFLNKLVLPHGKICTFKKYMFLFLSERVFLYMKYMKFEKTNAERMLDRFREGEVLLAPCVIKSCRLGPEADALLEVTVPSNEEVFRFVVETKARSTPEMIQTAASKARDIAGQGDWPMIQVPYLSADRIAALEAEEVSGVDLCGNGVVVVPGKICVVRTGNPNLYPDSRPLSNPFRGRSAIVARMLLKKQRWEKLSDLAAAIEANGVKISLGQVSKAIQAMKEELLVSKSNAAIELIDPLALLDRLAAEWRGLFARGSRALRLPDGLNWADALSSNPLLRWAMTGESSVARYAMFSQAGPRKIAVSSLPLALTLLGGDVEQIPNFADVQLREIEEPGCYFDNAVDEQGVRWASKLQTWLELQAGDARQREAAADLRSQIIKEIGI
jgi:hypothetical protein